MALLDDNSWHNQGTRREPDSDKGARHDEDEDKNANTSSSRRINIASNTQTNQKVIVRTSTSKLLAREKPDPDLDPAHLHNLAQSRPSEQPQTININSGRNNSNNNTSDSNESTESVRIRIATTSLPRRADQLDPNNQKSGSAAKLTLSSEKVEEKNQCDLEHSVSSSKVVDQTSNSKEEQEQQLHPNIPKKTKKKEEEKERVNSEERAETKLRENQRAPLGAKWLDVLLSGVRQTSSNNSKQQATSCKNQSEASLINKEQANEIDNRESSKEGDLKSSEEDRDKRAQVPGTYPQITTNLQRNILNHNLFDKSPHDSPASPPVPSFGETAIKLHRLPYYTYQGRAKNVALVSASDRRGQLKRSSNLINSNSSQSSSSSSSTLWSPPPPLGQLKSEDSFEAKGYNSDQRKRELQTRGYSNISNLFPDKPMLTGRHRAGTNKSQFNNSGINSEHNHKPISSKSFLSLNDLVGFPQQVFSKQRPAFNNYTRSCSTTTMRRHNSLLGGQAGGPLGGGGANSAATGGVGSGGAVPGAGAKGNIPGHVAGRSASVSGNYGLAGARTQHGHHRRSPSAGSLHYNGMAPEAAHHGIGYGRDQDNDYPDHGMSGYDFDKAGDSPTQMLDAESPYGYPLYNSRRRGPVYYEGKGAAGERLGGRGPNYASAYSLYSPTSPIEARPGAYYDRESRFSVYQSMAAAAAAGPGAQSHRDRSDSGYKSAGLIGPGAGQVRSSLAPPKEQIRRILGYPAPTKPVHLHPQWAYSRPFHHLLPSGAEWTPPSPVAGDPDGGLFIDYDDDINQLNASLLRFSPFNKLEDTQAIRAVDFHPSGQVYAIGSNSRALRICAYPAPSELNSFGANLLAGTPTAGATGQSPVGSPIMTGGGATAHHQYLANTPQSPRVLFKFLQVHRGSIYCVRFNKTGQFLATGSNDQTVHIVRYNSRTHSPEGDEYRLTMHDGTVRDLCFIDDATSGNSLLISAGGGDNKIYVTDCDTITPFQSFAGHTGMVMGLHHLGGAQFVSGSQDRTIRFWDLRTRQCTSIVSAPPARPGNRWGAGGPGAPVCAVQADHSGRLLVSGHTDSTCMLYDIRGGRIIQAFKPHEDEIRTVSFSPKSYYLLTGAYDGRIILSDLQGDLNQPLPSVCVAESDDKIIQSRWHPTDFTFVTTSANKTATLWVPPTDGH